LSRIVLDAGALIALARNDRSLWSTLKLAALSGDDAIVPAAVLAQAWRGTPSQARLAAALKHCVVASFDAVVRDVGELCERAKTRDVCDAHVAIIAATRGDVLYTSDPNDLRRLLVAYGGRVPSIGTC
jgi:predicted nucleic acid-binding protein